MRVLIADDQPSVRSALRLALEQNGISVVGDVADSSGLWQWLGAGQADLILLDWELPLQTGKKMLQALRVLSPGMAVIVLSSQPQARMAALTAGADGFVCKGEPLEYLLQAVSRLKVGAVGFKYSDSAEGEMPCR